jgi:hypothetical protein
MSQGTPKKDSFNPQPASAGTNWSSSKEGPSSVDFFCCLTLSQSSFYLFLNVLDLVYATLVTMLAILFTVEDSVGTIIGYLKVSLGTLNILLFGLAAVAFIVYLVKLRFDTSVHKIYSIVRLVVCGIRYSLHSH